jgi:hypothetical protein
MEFRHFQTYRLPRGRRYEIPWFQATAPPPPAFPPRTVRARAKAYAIRRGTVLDVALVAQPAPQLLAAAGRRRLALPVRRGHRFDAPLPVVVVAPPAFAPAIVRSQRRALPPRRGLTFEVVPGQGVPLPPIRGTRGRMPSTRRGHRFDRFGHGVTPHQFRRARTTVASLRRGHVLSVVPAPVISAAVWPPSTTAAKRRALPFRRRPGLSGPVPAQVVAPPTWAPPIVAARRRIGVRIRRGWRSFVIALGFAATVPVPDIPTELSLDQRRTSLTLGHTTEMSLSTRSTEMPLDSRTTAAALDPRTTLLTEGARSTDLPLDKRKTEVITDG